MVLHITLAESIPTQRRLFQIYWPQGHFYLGDQSRVATVTDVKFLNADCIVVAHRAAAKLSILDIRQERIRFLHTLRLSKWTRRLGWRRFIHPDLIALAGDTIYISTYTREFVTVRISKNRLSLESITPVIGDDYHGCAVIGQEFYLGGVESGKIMIYNPQSRGIRHLDVEMCEHRRIKTIATEGEHFVLSLDNCYGSDAKGCYGDAWFARYSQVGSKLIEVDSCFFKYCQIDGHCRSSGFHFISLHSGTDQCGYIVTLRVGDTIEVVKRTKCDDFPHGIDIYEGMLAYTSYSTSSVHIRPLAEFLP